MTITIISWYWRALIHTIIYVNELLALVFAASEIVARSVYVALFTFFIGTGATRFLLSDA